MPEISELNNSGNTQYMVVQTCKGILSSRQGVRGI